MSASRAGAFEPFTAEERAAARTDAAAPPEPTPIIPVPEDAPEPPAGHQRHGPPTGRWAYRDADGRLVGYVDRFDFAKPDGSPGKEILPLTFCELGGGKRRWRAKGIPEPRPLYNLTEIAAGGPASEVVDDRPPVLVCEGEKAADAASKLFPGLTATTPMHGAGSPGKTDWSPLRGRRVIVWPDKDQPGREFADEVARLALEAGAVEVRIVQVPDHFPEKWDLADALPRGETVETLHSLLSNAEPSRPAPSGRAETEGQDVRSRIATSDEAIAEVIRALAGLPQLDYERQRRAKAEELGMRAAVLDGAVRAARRDPGEEQQRATQRDELAAIGMEHELWHDDAHQGYASVRVDGHVEHHRIRTARYRRLLVRLYGDRHPVRGPNGAERPGVPGQQALAEALVALEAQADRGPLGVPGLRIGEHRGKVYLDLCRDDWAAVEVDASDWRIVREPPVRFVRSDGMLPLPVPVRGDGLGKLRKTLALGPREADANDTRKERRARERLVIGWLVGCFRPRGPYPVLAVHGEQGSGKTTLFRILRSCVDPNKAPARARPRDERDLLIAASNGWLLPFDNLSKLDQDLSDAMCRVSTGAGFSTRTLFTDADETLFQVCRPQLVNGIPDLAQAGDLIDRAIVVELPRCPSGEIGSEEELWEGFGADAPEILGALLDAVSTALRRLEAVELRERPRMVDFARWVEAAAPALGWAEGEFLDAYLENRGRAARIALEADPVAAVVLRWVEKGNRFSGQAEGLLEHLNGAARDDERHARGWPRTAHHLGNRLRRAAPGLRRAGFVVEFTRNEHARTVRLEKAPETASGASAASSSRPSGGGADAADADDAVRPSSSEESARTCREAEPGVVP